MTTTAAVRVLSDARQGLDPAGRALLDLWVHRDLDDATIARLSGGSAEDVARRRARLVEGLALETQLSDDEVRAALDALRDDGATLEAPTPRRRASAATRAAASPPRGRWTGRLPWLAGSILGALVLAFLGITALTGREPEPGASSASRRSASVAEARAVTGARVGRESLAPVSGGPDSVSGMVTRSGNRLVVRTTQLDGDPRDFQVWLFDSVAEAHALGSLDVGTYTLPADAGQYGSVDVSRQRITAGAAAHNGRSVLRGPLPTG